MVLLAASFGSFGDIVSLAQCAIKIVRALRDSRGASMGYQTFVAEIDAFRLALPAVERALESPDLPEDARRAIGHSLAECASLRADVDRRIAAWQAALRQGSWRKIGWSLFKREELSQMREHIAAHLASVAGSPSQTQPATVNVSLSAGLAGQRGTGLRVSLHRSSRPLIKAVVVGRAGRNRKSRKKGARLKRRGHHSMYITASVLHNPTDVARFRAAGPRRPPILCCMSPKAYGIALYVASLAICAPPCDVLA